MGNDELPSSHRISRRDFLKAAGVTGGAAFLTACGISNLPESPEPPTPIPHFPTDTTIPMEITLPTKTEIIPTETATPLPTNTEIPTATITETELPVNWAEEYFIPVSKQQELRDKGAIILTDLPVDQWKDLKVTGPGQAYVACDRKDILRNPIKFLTEFFIDRIHFGEKICVDRTAFRQEISDFYKSINSSASSDNINQLTDDYIEVSQSINPYLPKGFFYWDLYYALGLDVDPNNTNNIHWKIFEADAENSFSKAIITLDIPATTTKATPTP